MTRVVLIVLFVTVILTVVALVDCALAPGREVRTLPKPLWIVIVIIFPVVGPILWFVIGRARSGRSGVAVSRPAPSSPDDDPRFLRGLDSEARVLRLEEELRRLDDEDLPSDGSDGRGPGRGDA